MYFWVQIIGWEYNHKYPKAIVNDIFNYGKTAEGETEVILHELKIDQTLATLKANKI